MAPVLRQRVAVMHEICQIVNVNMYTYSAWGRSPPSWLQVDATGMTCLMELWHFEDMAVKGCRTNWSLSQIRSANLKCQGTFAGEC